MRVSTGGASSSLKAAYELIDAISFGMSFQGWITAKSTCDGESSQRVRRVGWSSCGNYTLKGGTDSKKLGGMMDSPLTILIFQASLCG